MQQYNIQRIYIFWAKHLVHSEIVQAIVTSFKAIKDPTPFNSNPRGQVPKRALML